MTPPNFTLVQLRYFVAAAETGSMTAAARQLVISQSAISTAVGQLERELGVQLLIRHHARGLTLTPSGERFLPSARALLTHAEEVGDSAQGLGRALTGELVVGCFTTLAPFYLPQLLTDFSGRFPRVRVSVVEGQTPQLEAALQRGEIELALLYDLALASDIEREVLALASPYALVAPDHRLAGRANIELVELAGDPMVLLDIPQSAEYFRSLALAAGFEPQIKHRTASYEAARSMVASGHGFSLLNQRPVHNTTYDGGTVVALGLRDGFPPLEIVLASPRGVRSTARAGAFGARARAVVAAPSIDSA